MNLVLDAGALIAIDRGDRRTAALIELGRRSAANLVTTAPVVGQAWRSGSRQARLARSMSMIDVRTVSLRDGQDAGELLGEARSSDIVDALLATIVLPGDQVLTSDPEDLPRILGARGVETRIVTV